MKFFEIPYGNLLIGIIMVKSKVARGGGHNQQHVKVLRTEKSVHKINTEVHGK